MRMRMCMRMGVGGSHAQDGMRTFRRMAPLSHMPTPGSVASVGMAWLGLSATNQSACQHTKSSVILRPTGQLNTGAFVIYKRGFGGRTNVQWL